MSPQQVKWLVQAIAAALLLGLGFEAGKRWEAEGWLKKEVARLEADQARVEKAAEARLQTSLDYHEKVRKLEDDYRNRPARVVRVCNQPAKVPDTAGQSDGASEGGIQTALGPDIGDKLYALAEDADKCALQLGELQAWWKTVATPEGK